MEDSGQGFYFITTCIPGSSHCNEIKTLLRSLWSPLGSWALDPRHDRQAGVAHGNGENLLPCAGGADLAVCEILLGRLRGLVGLLLEPTSLHLFSVVFS